MSKIKALYRRRDKYTAFGILTLLLTPLPGLSLGCFLQASCIDKDIRTMTINKDDPDVIFVYCDEDKKSDDKIK